MFTTMPAFEFTASVSSWSLGPIEVYDAAAVDATHV